MKLSRSWSALSSVVVVFALATLVILRPPWRYPPSNASQLPSFAFAVELEYDHGLCYVHNETMSRPIANTIGNEAYRYAMRNLSAHCSNETSTSNTDYGPVTQIVASLRSATSASLRAEIDRAAVVLPLDNPPYEADPCLHGLHRMFVSTGIKVERRVSAPMGVAWASGLANSTFTGMESAFLVVGWEKSGFTTAIIYNDQGVSDPYAFNQSFSLGADHRANTLHGLHRHCIPSVLAQLSKTMHADFTNLFHYSPLLPLRVALYGEAARSQGFKTWLLEALDEDHDFGQIDIQSTRLDGSLDFIASQGGVEYVWEIYQRWAAW